MRFAVYQNIVYFACVQMDSEENRLKDAHDPNVLLTAIVKLRSDVNLARAEIHVFSLVLVVSTLNVESLIDRSNAHVHPDILAIRPSNARLKRMRALEIRADQILDVETLVAAMNALVHQDALAIHTKDVCAERRQLCALIILVDEMLPAESSIKMNQSAIAHHFIQMETHTMNVRIEFHRI